MELQDRKTTQSEDRRLQPPASGQPLEPPACEYCGATWKDAELRSDGVYLTTTYRREMVPEPKAEKLLAERVRGKSEAECEAAWLELMAELGLKEAERLYFKKYYHPTSTIVAATECASCRDMAAQYDRQFAEDDAYDRATTWNRLVQAFGESVLRSVKGMGVEYV